jgi:hypothetical protein
MVRDSFLIGLKSILRWNEPEPAIAPYHWSEACCVNILIECTEAIVDGETYMAIEYRGEIDSCHEQIVAHVVLTSSSSRPQVR